jgi:hypothetical protein
MIIINRNLQQISLRHNDLSKLYSMQNSDFWWKNIDCLVLQCWAYLSIWMLDRTVILRGVVRHIGLS